MSHDDRDVIHSIDLGMWSDPGWEQIRGAIERLPPKNKPNRESVMSDLLKSKKAIACLVGLVAVVLSMILGKLGVSIPEERIHEVLVLLASYILGQGLADVGKSKAEIMVRRDPMTPAKDAPNPTTPPVA